MAYKNYIFQYNQNRKGKMENNEKNFDILNQTSESAPIKSTNIKTNNSSNEVNSKTTKPIITTKQLKMINVLIMQFILMEIVMIKTVMHLQDHVDI